MSRQKYIHLNSDSFDTLPPIGIENGIEIGEIAINYAENNEFMSIVNSGNHLVRFDRFDRGSYVPFQPDGSSIAALADGALQVVDTNGSIKDAFRLVPAPATDEGEKTALPDVQINDDIANTILSINPNNKPVAFDPSKATDGYFRIDFLLLDADGIPIGGATFRFSDVDNISFDWTSYDTWEDNITVIRKNGIWMVDSIPMNFAHTILVDSKEAYVVGDGGPFVTIEQMETFLLPESWKPSDATLGYPQPSRAHIGDYAVPPKILTPTGVRPQWREYDGTEHQFVAPEDLQNYAEKTETIIYDENGSIMAGETLLAQFGADNETWGNQTTHTSLASVDRPEVLNPPPGVKTNITNPDLLSWADDNADFKDPSPRGWRIPTRAEIVALDAAGRGNWTQLNGINGRYFGGIFFPAAGRRRPDGVVDNQSITGGYWSCTASNGTNGYYLDFGNANVSPAYSYTYTFGFNIRCVRNITTTDFEPCPAGELQVGNVIWALSNLSDVETFAPTAETYGAFFQWGQNVAIGGDGELLVLRHKIAYLSDILQLPPPLTVRVTNMFTIPSAAEFIVEQHLPDKSGGPSYIKLSAHDTSGETNDLIITCPFGMGCPNFIPRPYVQAIQNSNGEYSFDYRVITISAETNDTPSQIFIPKELNSVWPALEWFIGNSDIKASYWADINWARYSFENNNTPLSEFTSSGSVSTKASTMAVVSFGTSYQSETTIPQGFLGYDFRVLTDINISGLNSVTNYQANAFIGLSNLYKLNIGSIDATNITNIGSNVFLGAGSSLTESIIYADTIELGEAFKAKFTNLSSFTVHLNP